MENKKLYKVVDNDFNKSHYSDIIGKTYINPPSYASTKEITGNPEDAVDYKKNKSNLKEYIQQEVVKFHKQVMLESELEEVNKELTILKEGENVEEKTYESNVYESYRKDLEEVVKNLAEACNKLESAALRQESHMRTIPEVTTRIEEGKRHKQVILDIFKEVKKAKLAAERKLYEMR